MSVTSAHASAKLFSRPANRADRRRPLISLTPLIDVVFILLIFFMLVSSFLDWRSINLNAPAKAAAGSSVEGALLVEVRTDGLRLAGETVSPELLEARIDKHLTQKPKQRIVVKPAVGVTLQNTVAVLDLLAAAGATHLSLIRDPTH